MKPKVFIYGWYKTSAGNSSWLCGYVKGHPRLPDGEFVRTSPIVNELSNGFVETANTIYELGPAMKPQERGEYEIDL